MPATEAEYIKIRKRDILIILLLAIVFAAGYFANDFVKGKPAGDKNICTQFCDLAGLEFAFVKDDACYCYQRQVFYNQQKNKTVQIYQAVNAGVIKNISVTEGLTQETRNLLQTR
jgi:hypothetical protein